MAARLTTDSCALLAFQGDAIGDIGTRTSGRIASAMSAAAGRSRTHRRLARSDGTGTPEQATRPQGENNDHQDAGASVLPWCPERVETEMDAVGGGIGLHQPQPDPTDQRARHAAEPTGKR